MPYQYNTLLCWKLSTSKIDIFITKGFQFESYQHLKIEIDSYPHYKERGHSTKEGLTMSTYINMSNDNITIVCLIIHQVNK